MALGWQRAPYFRRRGREMFSKSETSLKKSQGATVELLNVEKKMG